jgi:hypothetical protein
MRYPDETRVAYVSPKFHRHVPLKSFAGSAPERVTKDCVYFVKFIVNERNTFILAGVMISRPYAGTAIAILLKPTK